VSPLEAKAPSGARPIHVLTLTPFFPSEHDDAGGCFVAEPLDWVAKVGVTNTVFAVQPFYRQNSAGEVRTNRRNGCAIFRCPAALDYRLRVHFFSREL